MALKSSDLPRETKRQLAEVVRERLGASTYDDMVRLMGEDEVLDAVLSAVSGDAPSVRAVPRRETAWQAAATLVLRLLSEYNLWYVCVALIGSGGWVGAIMILVALVVIFFGAAFFHGLGALEAISTALAWIVGIAGVAVAAGLVGYGLWVGGPWLVKGVGQWWGWLGGHFK